MDNNDGKILNKLARELTALREDESSPNRPFPSRLWAEAANVARRVGVGPVSRALKLEYCKLKRLTFADDNGDSSREDKAPLATFLELSGVPSQDRLVCCAVEVESPSGARMRIQIQDASFSGLATLVREFAV